MSIEHSPARHSRRGKRRKPKRKRRRQPPAPPPTADDIARMMQRKVTRQELVSIFNAKGYPISLSTLNKRCMPSCNTGPPVDGWWGRLAMHCPHRGLDWARENYRPVSSAVVAILVVLCVRFFV
jgi:hypothetical protein